MHLHGRNLKKTNHNNTYPSATLYFLSRGIFRRKTMKKVITCIAILASFIGLGLGCWRMETKNTVDITKFDEKSLHGVALVLREQYMVLNAKKEPYLTKETYDHKIIKEINVKGLDQVDTGQLGVYDLTYEFTADARALDDYLKGEEVKSSTNPKQTVMIPIKSTVTIVSKEKAIELRKSGKLVYGL